MQTKALWLGFSVSDELAKELFLLDPMPAVQTHKFGWSFAKALKQAFGEVTLASTCPVQSYPLVRQLIFRGGSFSSQGMNGVLIGFVNLLLLKHVTRLANCMLSVALLIKRQRINWIFLHGLHTPYLVFGLMARQIGCRVAVVLTDPPGVALATDSKLAKIMKQIDAWFIGHVLRRMDAVLALAPELVLRLAPNRPALVFPGILESTLVISAGDPTINPRRVSSTEPFTIVYAGGLSQAYGVDRLCDAVLSFEPDVNVRLKLYGRGDQVENIRRLAAWDSRISYGGFVDAAILLPELCTADLLINPRPTGEDFAAMSFPSKLIEYLATGRPVLTTRILSIPKELDEHFFYIDDESKMGIGAAIREVMMMPAFIRAGKGIAAQQFVREHLSEAAIGRKIADFIKKLN